MPVSPSAGIFLNFRRVDTEIRTRAQLGACSAQLRNPSVLPAFTSMAGESRGEERRPTVLSGGGEEAAPELQVWRVQQSGRRTSQT